jgi:hypothetical protein
MIKMHSATLKEITAASGKRYVADAGGVFHDVSPGDMGSLQGAGAVTIVHPATLDLKVEPNAQHHFLGKIHKADERGVIAGVPFDQAQVLIRNGTAVELTPEDLTNPADEVVVVAETEGDASDETPA